MMNWQVTQAINVPSPYFDLLILFFVSNYLKSKYQCLNGLIKDIIATT